MSWWNTATAAISAETTKDGEGGLLDTAIDFLSSPLGTVATY